jgi:hypothetical protein
MSFNLVEELQRIGAGNLDSMVEFSGARSQRSSLSEAADALYTEIRNEVDEDLIDYDVNQFESDLRNQLKARLESTVADGVPLEEAMKMIRRLVGGVLLRAKQRILTGGEKMKAKLGRLATRAKRKLMGKRYRRKATTKRREGKRRKLKAKMGESVAEELRGLLTESVQSGLSDEHQSVIEAYERVSRVAALLGDFFEAFGSRGDEKIADVMDEAIEAAELRIEAIEAGKVNLESELPKVQGYVKMLGKTLEKYNSYDLVRSGN